MIMLNNSTYPSPSKRSLYYVISKNGDMVKTTFVNQHGSVVRNTYALCETWFLLKRREVSP